MSIIKISDFYTYTEDNPSLGGATISTQTLDSNISNESIRYGFRAFSTQKIMNNFPAWINMREDHNSIGQSLVHSWAHHLDDTIALYDEYRADQFLATANTYKDINLGVSELSFQEENVYENKFINLIYNSSFSIQGAARLQKPEGWFVERDILDGLKFNRSQSLYGTHALELDNTNGNTSCLLKQSREIQVNGGSINLSIFVKSIGSNGTTSNKFNPDEAGIILVLNYNDNTTKSFGLGFPENTEDKWARASFSVTIDKPVFKYEIIIINRTANKYIIDLPLLEKGTSASYWTPSPLDKPPYLEMSSRSVTGVQVLLGNNSSSTVLKREIFETTSQNEFKDVLIPTRLELTSTEIDPLNSFNLEFGKEVNYREEVLATKWFVAGTKIRQGSILTPDVYGEDLLPADLYLDESGNLLLDKSAIDSDNITVEAVTIYSNWLLAVTKETYLNKTRRVLKFIIPYKLTYEDTVMQSMGDIEIPLNLSANVLLNKPEATISRIGICKNKPFCIFIDTSNNQRFYFEMKYDYFYADLRKRKIFCRENYTLANSKLQII